MAKKKVADKNKDTALQNGELLTSAPAGHEHQNGVLPNCGDGCELDGDWSDWYEERVDCQHSKAIPSRRRPCRDAYEKSKTRYSLKRKLPAIQETESPVVAMQTEEKLDHGETVMSETEDGNHVSRVNISPLPQPMSTNGIQQSKKSILEATWVHKHYQEFEEGSDITEAQHVAVKQTDHVKIEVETDLEGKEQERVSVESEGSEDTTVSTSKSSSSPFFISTSRFRWCIVVVIILIVLGVVASAVAAYFAISVIGGQNDGEESLPAAGDS